MASGQGHIEVRTQVCGSHRRIAPEDVVRRKRGERGRWGRRETALFHGEPLAEPLGGLSGDLVEVLPVRPGVVVQAHDQPLEVRFEGLDQAKLRRREVVEPVQQEHVNVGKYGGALPPTRQDGLPIKPWTL